MNLLNWKMNIKNHQYSALLVVFGIMIGACLHYLFFNQNMNYVRKNAYQEGFYDGRDSTTKEIIRGIYEADSTVVSENEIIMYYK